MSCFMYVRLVERHGASAMAALLNAIITLGGTTAHRQPFTDQELIMTFIEPQRAISCFVAIVEDKMAGFQALE